MLGVAMLGVASAQEMETFGLPQFLHDQQRFHDDFAQSRWAASQMEYVDGASSAVLRHPYTIAHAPDGELFVASFTLNHVVKLRFSGDSTKRAQYKVFVKGRDLDGPVGMALDDDGGALYVSSFTNDVVLRVNASTGDLLARIGSDETLDCPEGVALHGGKLFVASFLLPHLSTFDPLSGNFLGTFGSAIEPWAAAVPQRLPTKRPTLAGAEDLTFDLNGDVHVTAYYSGEVFKFNGTDGRLRLRYGKGIVDGPVGIATDPYTGDLFIASYRTNQVLRFSPEGQFVGVAAGSEASTAGQRQPRGRRATLASPSGLAFDDDGTLWVASYATGAVTRFNGTSLGSVSGRTWRVTE